MDIGTPDDDATLAIEGVASDEELIRVRAGCSLACPFCTYSQGNVGSSLDEVLAPDFKVPSAGHVLILAGDVLRADLAPLVRRLRDSGTSDVSAYAHSGVTDLAALDVLSLAGMNGLHLVLPSAAKASLSALTGGRGTLTRAATLIDRANALQMRVTLDVPVVERSRDELPDTVRRALNRVANPRNVVVRLLNEGRGPAWDRSLARDAIVEAAEIARVRGVSLQFGHHEAPPPCLLDLPRATPDMYPSFATPGQTRSSPLPFEACSHCAVERVCTLEAGVGAPEPPGLKAVDPVVTGQGPDTRPRSVELFLRQDRLQGLLDEFRRRAPACRFPWEELEAHDIRGVVTPCAGGWPLLDSVNRCTSWHGHSLLGAWNSVGMQEFRRAHAARDPFRTCKRECPAFHGGTQSAIPPLRTPVSRRFYDNLILNFEEMLAGAEVLQSRPLAISISPTLRCPNRCRMCDIHEMLDLMGNGPELREMPDAQYEELLELLPTTRMLALTGGEPLVSRRVRDLLKAFTPDRCPDGSVTVTTNGLLLREPLIRDLSGTRIRLFYVSLNAATGPTYEHQTETRGGFDRVLRNVQTLLTMAPRMAGRPRVLLSFVVMRSNFHELPAFLDLALAMGVGVRVQPIERDRCGESIFTDEATLRRVLDVIALQARPRVARAPQSYRAEVARVESILRGKLERADFTPL